MLADRQTYATTLYTPVEAEVSRTKSGESKDVEFASVVLYYIFPVLWMTSCFPTMGPTTACCYGSSLAAVCIRPNTPAAA